MKKLNISVIKNVAENPFSINPRGHSGHKLGVKGTFGDIILFQGFYDTYYLVWYISMVYRANK